VPAVVTEAAGLIMVGLSTGLLAIDLTAPGDR
jgi:hypothetical protein